MFRPFTYLNYCAKIHKIFPQVTNGLFLPFLQYSGIVKVFFYLINVINYNLADLVVVSKTTDRTVVFG